MKLFIFVGVGQDFGTGHETRMQELQALLAPASPITLALGNSQNKVSRELAQSVQQFTKQIKVEVILRSFHKTEEALQELAQINNNAKSSDSFVFILDLRELNPYPFLEKGSVLTLDNYHPIRYASQNKLEAQETNTVKRDSPNKMLFHDTLPHPYSASHSHKTSPSYPYSHGDPDKILELALISPYLLNRSKKQVPIQNKALFCAGPFQELPELFGLFSTLIAKKEKRKPNYRRAQKTEQDSDNAQGGFGIEEMLWLGTRSKDRRLWPLLSFKPRIPRLEFWDYLSKAQIVFCYPGMTLLEAWFLNKSPVLFSTESKTHNTLSAYLEESAGFIYLKNKSNDCREFLKAYHSSQVFSKEREAAREGSNGKDISMKRKSTGPSGKGYAILLQKLQSLKSRTI